MRIKAILTTVLLNAQRVLQRATVALRWTRQLQRRYIHIYDIHMPLTDAVQKPERRNPFLLKIHSFYYVSRAGEVIAPTSQ